MSLEPSEVAARWPADRPLLWLHSGRVHPRWARWSVLASPRARFVFDGHSRLLGELPPELSVVRLAHDPLHDLDTILSQTALNPHTLTAAAAPFRGGWIGFLSYDLGRIIEPRAQQADALPVSPRWPLIELAWCPDALVFDHVHQRWSAIGEPPSLLGAIDGAHDDAFHLGATEPDITAEIYERMVARTIEHIGAGDVFQANIAHRFRGSFEGSARALATAAFREARPWYGAYLELGDVGRRLLSLSPELFLHVNPLTRRVITRPIKGTRPAACDPRELRDSVKDEAELNMIVDLMRNDLGRACEFGSVRVPQPRTIESHPTVHHGVAEITGRLREGVAAGDLLRATFPPGSVTGAPKIRAMQIIDELERRRRGPYCGAIGFFSDCGAITLNVAIRTLMLQGDAAHYWAGAGIVADSSPAAEYRETLDKAAVLAALSPRSPMLSAMT